MVNQDMIYPGLLLQNRYRVVQLLGEGGQCKTWQVDDLGTRKVMKELKSDYYKCVELFQREAEVLKQLNNPGIPRVEPDGYFTFSPEGARAANPSQIPPDATTHTIDHSSSNGQNQTLHCLVMEFIEGQNLEKWLEQRGNQPIAQKQAIDWLKQLVEILAQVHDQKYFHRDIKPSNIIRRPDGQLVLIDFGTAREETITYLTKLETGNVTRLGTPYYAPPEQVNGKAVQQSDFFALGRTFVYLLTAKPLEYFQEDLQTYQFQNNWRDSARQVSKQLADLIDDLMAPSPENRPQDAQEVWQRLEIISYPRSRVDWGKAPEVLDFYGRASELDTLKQWIGEQQCRLVALLGMGGIGKTALAVKLAQEIQGEFEYVIWRSLRNAPPLNQLLGETIQFLSNQQETDDSISRLILSLQESRCLLILDQWENILPSGELAGYQEGYEGYGELLKLVGTVRHKSCLLLTSQNKPGEIASLEERYVRFLQLDSLGEAARKILKEKCLSKEEYWETLIQLYRGNPLALKLVSTTISELFNGDVLEFIRRKTLVFGGIRALLSEQYGRLKALEKDILLWLAKEQKPVSLPTSPEEISLSSTQAEFIEEIESLLGKSLIEKITGEEGTALFTLQPVVMEYILSQEQ